MTSRVVTRKRAAADGTASAHVTAMFELTPICWRCEEPIRPLEALWRELPSGGVRASFAVDLTALALEGRRLWHLECRDPTARPQPPALDRAASGLPLQHTLAGAVI